MSGREGIAISISLLSFGLCGALISNFFSFHQVRIEEAGIPFNDPVLGILPSADVSFPIFVITYGAVLLFFVSQWRAKEGIILFGFSAAIIQLFRIATLTILPLQPPDDLVPLNDPFLNELIYPGTITSDLFFSGHTATLFLLYFISKKKYFLVLAIALMLLLLIQHVHFSIDVLGAIPFAWIAVEIVFRLKQWIGNKLNLPTE